MDREVTHSKVAGFALVSYTAALADLCASSSKLRQRKAELSEAGDSVLERMRETRDTTFRIEVYFLRVRWVLGLSQKSEEATYRPRFIPEI